MTDKIVILVIGSNYDEVNILWTSRECQVIQDVIRKSRDRDNFDLHLCPELKREELIDQLSWFKPQIIHFIGHCDSEAGFLFSGDKDPPIPEYFDQLVKDLRNYQHLIRLVVFNGCRSQRIAKVVGNFIPYTIGTSEDISDKPAICFAESFYRSFGNGDSYSSSFQNGVQAYIRDYQLGIESDYLFFENKSEKMEAIVRYRSGSLKIIEEQIEIPRVKALLYTTSINMPFQFQINPSDENHKLFLLNCMVNISQILQMVINGFHSLLRKVKPRPNEESLVKYLNSKINFLFLTAKLFISSINSRQFELTAIIFPTIMHPDYTYEICEMPLIQTYEDFIKIVLL